MAVKGDIIALSGLLDTTAVTGEELMGTGISYSTDSGENWIFLSQPIDAIPETGKYQTILWGEQEMYNDIFILLLLSTDDLYENVQDKNINQ